MCAASQTSVKLARLPLTDPVVSEVEIENLDEALGDYVPMLRDEGIPFHTRLGIFE